MRVAQLIKHGNSSSCFEIAEREKPNPKQGEVLIKVKAFGLNYADVMARQGLYREAPPLPSILGYDVVGVIERVGTNVSTHWIGKQVVAVTEFGGYAEYAIANEFAFAEVPTEMPLPSAAALATQYATAYYAAFKLSNIQPDDHVFIHAAAGGVGLALIQFCQLKGCIMYGSVSTDKKAELIKSMGVQYVINTSKQNIYEEFQKLQGQLDVIFDGVGGKVTKAGFKALRAGGRHVFLGGSQLTEGKGIFNLLRFVWSLGFYTPVQFLANSKSMLGLNMLKLIRSNPKHLQEFMTGTIQLLKEKKIAMPVGESFPIEKLFEAHMHLQSRKSIGKIIIEW
jgi:NADPH:quinone reductase-like Zn-dependent oxidoreductase